MLHWLNSRTNAEYFWSPHFQYPDYKIQRSQRTRETGMTLAGRSGVQTLDEQGWGGLLDLPLMGISACSPMPLLR